MDRAHRIGQKKEVQVFRFCIDNSIEEKVRLVRCCSWHGPIAAFVSRPARCLPAGAKCHFKEVMPVQCPLTRFHFYTFILVYSDLLPCSPAR